MSTQRTLDPVAIAHRHAITHTGPAVDFFAGALLGNGGLGITVTTRPDAVVLHFGHNNVWDIRVAEDHADEIGTFEEIFAKVAAISPDLETLEHDPWYRDYCTRMAHNYAQPYPRPFPCGSLILGFDRRHVELIGHALDIADGRCTIDLLQAGVVVRVEIFCDQDHDRVWLRCLNAAGAPTAAPFDRIRLMPDPDGLAIDAADQPAQSLMDDAVTLTIPGEPRLKPGVTVPDHCDDHHLSFRQYLPAQRGVLGQNTHSKDRAFRLTLRSSAPLQRTSRRDWYGVLRQQPQLERTPINSPAPFVLCLELEEGLSSAIDLQCGTVPEATATAFEAAVQSAQANWQSYWQRSAIALGDALLEQTWYRNTYFMHCAVRAGRICPGLFANWSYRQVGTAWHGDYHMNYNTQQPFWGVFASNRIEQHIPYVDLVDHLLPISQHWAKDYYGLEGAYYPHSAYPTEMRIMPYPVPTWGWEICETPWTVQSLWWHFLYTQDKAFLRDRAWHPLREAVRFLVAYISRPIARGEKWNDDRWHIFPTVVPELYGLRPGFDKNADCLADLTLVRFVLRAYLKGCEVLQPAQQEADLMAATQAVLDHLPPYANAATPDGPVFVSAEGELADTVYNIPLQAMTIFPGEEHGLGSDPATLAQAIRSYRNQRLEGGNELVFANLQGARVGQLDLEKFKRQIQYCLLPNGTCTDMVLQTQGRYNDATPFAFMGPMGIWFENFALTAVINECLMQSYDGVIRLFPNWPLDQPAEFNTLRAVGAFLVSAKCAHGAVQWVEIFAETGGPLRMIDPWKQGTLIEMNLSPGQTVRFDHP